MLNFIKKYKHLIFIFITTFLIYWIFGFFLVYEDTIPSYGFSYAIANGEIPYRDFNIISTPLYAFIMSFGLRLSNTYFMFIIEQTILITISFYFLFKLYGKKSYLVYLSMVLLLFCGFLPTYNYMCFFCMIILLYLEKEYNDKDYLIGLFIGLAILSKHTVGVFFILPTLIIYYKDIKKVLKRALGALLPGVIFIIYLLITNSFNKFVDLCVLGLFDFSSNNASPKGFWFITLIIITLIYIIVILKDKKNILNYYLFFTVFFAVPLFDRQHIHWPVTALIIMLLPYINIKEKNIYRFVIPITIEFIFIYFIFSIIDKPIVFVRDIKHYNYQIRYKEDYLYYKKTNKLINRYYKEYNKVIFNGGYYQFFYDISNDRKINYYDVLLYGNYGNKGSNYIIDDLKKKHNTIFIYSKTNYDQKPLGQWDTKIIDYVRDNFKKLETKKIYEDSYDVYYKE